MDSSSRGDDSARLHRAVGVLGATGMVGQRFVQLLDGHPWFELVVVAASERSQGIVYRDVCRWRLATPLPDRAGDLIVRSCDVGAFAGVELVFSALDSAVAGPIEHDFAKEGFAVFTNAGNHRMNVDVPILVPFVNEEHLGAVRAQATKGFIVANANCSSTGLAVALKPLEDRFGIESAFITTMQAISGAGYPGVASLDVIDNMIPLIPNEEAKLESEPLKILGRWDASLAAFYPATITISAHCNRVAVSDGHIICCSVRLRKEVTPDEVRVAFETFETSIDELKLPSAPKRAIIVSTDPDRPQPRLDRLAGDGFTVTIGRIRSCPVCSIRFVCLSHNTILGAAGGSILNAELAVVRGMA